MWMADVEDGPPAYRVYDRTDNGNRRFSGVAIYHDRHGDNVRFRWAGERTLHEMPRAKWDALEKEQLRFTVLLEPRGT